MLEELEPKPPVERHAMWSAMAWLRDLLFSVVIAIVMILFLYQPVKVEGTSMMPTLEDQERIFINKFVYKFGIGEIQRLVHFRRFRQRQQFAQWVRPQIFARARHIQRTRRRQCQQHVRIHR